MSKAKMEALTSGELLTVEFIYDSECPNVGRARENLLRAFAQAAVSPKWMEWERSRSETPEHARQFGSPAILVNGKDVAGLPANSADACRIYQSATGVPSGVPPIELITEALTHGVGESGGAAAGAVKRHLPLVPAILVALLPKLACPACWPAYAGLLSAVGLGFLARTEYLLPVTAVFLTIVLAALTYRARTRRGYGPLFLGMIASAFVLLGKFTVHSNFLFYSGLVLLVGSSLWNTWPRKQSKTVSCCECAPAGSRCEQ